VARFVLAFYGTRGDVEPGIAVGRELHRRGHQVCLAVPPDLVGSAEAVGLPAIAYGPDTQTWLEDTRDFWAYVFRNFWRVRAVLASLRESREPGIRAWEQMSATLAAATASADVLVTGVAYQELAVNVADYQRIPLASVLWFPIRVNGRLLPRLPAPVVRALMTAYEWLVWAGVRTVENRQRRGLGLAPSTAPAPRRIAERGAVEIQAYDEVCFPGLAAEWASWNTPERARRPFVGTLTLELATDTDADVAQWIAAGTPPIFFGFGSIPVESPAETIAMIGAACGRLGERALIGAGWTDFGDVPDGGPVKVVGAVNYAQVFPACRAVVHHGGAGTTAAGLRAGVPTLILWMADVQVVWGAAVTRLGVGTARRFTATTPDTLVVDLRTILTPRCADAARDVAARMTAPADSAVAAADHLENVARVNLIGR
jgi:UDP:flavonoid glycosyltransferase YjiC (YdhE family)